MTTITQVQLVAPAQLGSSDAAVYTAPTSTTAKIGRAVFTNTTASAVTITAGITTGGALAAGTTMISARTVAPGEAYVSPEQVELPTSHHFGGGVYLRELFIPKGHTLIGRTHKKEHLCIFVCGDMTVVSDGARTRLTGYKTFVSAPGVKRAGYAHEDSIFVTVHRTDSKDLDEIERETVEPETEALFDSSNRLLENA